MTRYNPGVFNVRNIQDAKAIILTPEDSTTDRRWETETPYLGGLIQEHLALRERDRLMDFGCGIGRLSKALIDKSGCSAVGVDTSVTMRALAHPYVMSDRFLTCAPGMLDAFAGLHHAIAVWVLQHIPEPSNAITTIHQNLRSHGKLFVVNMTTRALPMSDGTWVDDKRDVRELLAARFDEIAHGALEAEQTTPATARGSFWGVYQRRS